MKIVVVGAGPTGLVLSAALARRGHHVALIDRDAGPSPDGTWDRKGVMQFHHAHAVRPQMTKTLLAELPEAHERWLAAGAQPMHVDTPGGRHLLGTRSRRSSLERAIRWAVERVPGVSLLTAHVVGVMSDNGRAAGVELDDGCVTADLVVDASGRSSRVTAGLPAADGCGGPCGLAYVGRQYRLLPGREPGPLHTPILWQAEFDGGQTFILPNEHRIFSVIVARDTSRRDLVALRHNHVFDAVARTLPGLAEWTDPDRSASLTPVLAGGQLYNHYRSQRTATGALRLSGLLSIGDAVCTTTPTFGRGLATSMMQVEQVLAILDSGLDPYVDSTALAEQFDDWCTANIRPWVEDHITMDLERSARWQGADLDLSRPLPADVILAAGTIDPEIQAAATPYLLMEDGPDSVRSLEARARSVYETGWRPPRADGPTRDELAAIVDRALRTGRGTAARRSAQESR